MLQPEGKDVSIKLIEDIEVPALGLGTWQLNGSQCVETVLSAIELGYRHIDTAQMYGNEEEVGRAVRDSGVSREKLFLTTKIDVENLSSRQLLTSAGQSLRKLDAEYIDLLLIHWPDPAVPLEESLEAMIELQVEGYVRQIGVSNFTPELVRIALNITPIFCNQVEYHPYLEQKEIVELAMEHGFLVTAYCPLARGAVLQDPTLAKIAEKYGKSPAQVALRWLVQQAPVLAIPKASSREHLESNLDIFDFELGEAEMDEIAGLAKGLRLVDPGSAPW